MEPFKIYAPFNAGVLHILNGEFIWADNGNAFGFVDCGCNVTFSCAHEPFNSEKSLARASPRFERLLRAILYALRKLIHCLVPFGWRHAFLPPMC